jgi:hypothetical protein
LFLFLFFCVASKNATGITALRYAAPLFCVAGRYAISVAALTELLTVFVFVFVFLRSIKKCNKLSAAVRCAPVLRCGTLRNKRRGTDRTERILHNAYYAMSAT